MSNEAMRDEMGFAASDFAFGQPWKGMIKIKRYEYHTLFEKISANGQTYRVCFLNWEIDKGKK